MSQIRNQMAPAQELSAAFSSVEVLQEASRKAEKAKVTRSKFSEQFEDLTWNVLRSFFRDIDGVMVKHQLDSYNDCMENIIPKIIHDPENQVIIPLDYDQDSGLPRKEYQLHWGDVSIGRPVIQVRCFLHLVYNSVHVHEVLHSSSLAMQDHLSHHVIDRFVSRTLDKFPS